MKLYDPQQLLTDWGKGLLTTDMAISQTLHHVNYLAQAHQSAAELPLQIEALKATMTTLKREFEELRQYLEKLQPEINALTGLNLTVYQLKNDVDSLRHHLRQE